MNNFIKMFSIIIGTFIGAGFASGKEIYIFFVQYGIYGFFGLIFSNIISGFILYKTLNLIYENNINNYSDFSTFLFGNNLFKKIFIYLINVFLLLSFFIMVSGFNSFFYQELNIPKIISCIFICFLCFNIFKKNISGILNINSILIPILIFIIFLFAFFDFSKINLFIILNNLQSNNLLNCFINAILYSSYNSILLIPILVSLLPFIKNKKQIRLLSLCSFLFLLTLSFIIFIFICFINNANVIEIPIISSISKFSTNQKNIYSIVIAIAILTSAISSGFCFINNLKNINNFCILLICIFPIFLINISFSFLVNLIFRIFGYIGLIQIIFILLKNSDKTDINIIK